MKNPFKKLFKIENNPPKTDPDVDKFIDGIRLKQMPKIMVDTDIAFREPPSKKIAEIRSLFEPVKFDELTFEEEIGDFNLSLLSKDAVKRIIEIIREDELNRHSSLMKTHGNSKRDNPDDDTWKAESFVINKDAESKLYRDKIEKELEGKTDAEQMKYFVDSFNKTSDYLKNTQSPEEIIKSIRNRKVIQDIGAESRQWVKERDERIRNESLTQESELLLKQIFQQFPQFTQLDETMLNLLNEHYKKIEKKNG